MNREICDRCPDEHTNKCNTCGKEPEPMKVTVEDAIKYFQEENERYEHMLGDRVNLLIDYKANQRAIEALEKLSGQAN